jgi:endonuclease G
MDELQAEAASRRKFPREESVKGGRKAIAAYLEGPPVTDTPIDSSERLPEAIILATGRPTLLIQSGAFEEPRLEIWSKRLGANRRTLQRVIPSVCRVEVLRHPRFEWLGTAWVVDERTLVTNRHVAAEFARRQGAEFVLLKNPFGEEIGVQVDFREEYRGSEPFEVTVDRVLFIADTAPGHPDIAILQLTEHGELPPPLTLASKDPQKDDPIAVIGYPAFDTRNDGVLMSRIFSDIYDVKRLAPGFVSFTEEAGVFEHDCTTLGGNSGSPVVHIESGEAIGLHFSGRFGVANFAVKAATVKQVLAGVRPSVSVGDLRVEDERRTDRDEYKNRDGYDERFLGGASKYHVPLPGLSADQLADATRVHEDRSYRGLSAYVLNYTHFSIVMCKSRRLAFYTAVNIDGDAEVTVSKKRPKWIFDPRIDRKLQIGDEVYGGRNKVDRGHLVRRLDPVWGSAKIGKQANDDTHIFTNAAPQQHTYNDQDWGDLEDYLLYNSNNDDVKLTVFTGPVFRETDVEWKGAQIPEEFWKVAVLVGPSRRLLAVGYLVSHRPYLDDLEFVPGQFNNYQVSLAKLEELTGLDFGKLRDHDPLSGVEAVGGTDVIPLKSLDEMLLG